MTFYLYNAKGEIIAYTTTEAAMWAARRLLTNH